MSYPLFVLITGAPAAHLLFCENASDGLFCPDGPGCTLKRQRVEFIRAAIRLSIRIFSTGNHDFGRNYQVVSLCLPSGRAESDSGEVEEGKAGGDQKYVP